MKKLLAGLVVIFLMLLSFKVGQRQNLFTQFMKHGPSSTSQNQLSAAFEVEKAAITSTLHQQGTAWNRGDIDGFMQDYIKSNDLRFASGGIVKYGWQTTLDGYKARYPDKATMGELAFTDLDIEVLSVTDALVFGRWKLKREKDTPNGLFTLHMRKMNGSWVIVSDHTSSAD